MSVNASATQLAAWRRLWHVLLAPPAETEPKRSAQSVQPGDVEERGGRTMDKCGNPAGQGGAQPRANREMDSDSVSSRVEFDPSGTGSIGVIELRCELEAMAYNFADLEACFGPESAYARFVLSQQRDALQAELSRCERLHAAGHSVPNPNDQRYQQWLELAREVRKHADIVQVFAEAGISLSRSGWNSSREAEEWAGGCFVCGGKDRFRVWRGCRAGYWCRQCGVHGDVLNAVRNLVPGCSALFAAVRYLAGQLGMPIQEREARRRAVTLQPKALRRAG